MGVTGDPGPYLSLPPTSKNVLDRVEAFQD